MMKVGFASTEGGCRHYRCELPARVLPIFGPFEVVVGGDLLVLPPGAPCPIAIDIGDGAEVVPEVIVLAGGYPMGLGWEIIEGAQAAGQRVVCDCDDWPILPTENPHYFAQAAERKIAALRAADAVTCSTPNLRDELGRHGIDATLIRNSIDGDRYRLERHENEGRRNVERATGRDVSPIVVGYRGMLAGFHDADVRELFTLRDLDDRFRFVHIGEDPRGASFAMLTDLDPARVEDRQAVEFDRYGPELAGIDLALIPLADRPFSQAKSNIAAMEWHAAGVPWLASQHLEFALAGNGAGLVRKPSQWAKMIADLAGATARSELYARQAGPVIPGGDRWAEVILSAAGIKS